MTRKPWPIALVLLVLLTVDAAAVPAAPFEGRLHQPDGTAFTARQRGDETYHWLETSQGFSVVQDTATNEYRFAERGPSGGLIPGPFAPGRDDPLTLGIPKQIEPTSAFQQAQRETLSPWPSGGGPMSAPPGPAAAPPGAPYVGTYRMLYVLVAFQNQGPINSTEADWEAQAFGAAPSMADYYYTVSGGQVTVIPAPETSGTVDNGVIDWITLSRDHPNGNANQVRAAVREAVLEADAYVDFAAFDDNSDGYLGQQELKMCFVFAGYEAAVSGNPSPATWAHHWSLSNDPPEVDGVIFGDYFGPGDVCSNGYSHWGEWWDNGKPVGDPDRLDQIAGIGVQVHELGHDFFLPDLYDTDGSSEGIGNFCVMAGGSWGTAGGTGKGNSPVFPSAWVRLQLGWETFTLLGGVQTVTAYDREIYKIRIAAGQPDQEYFLIENRQGTSYDAGLPGTERGLLIFHVDDNQGNNEDETQYMVDVEEASATQDLEQNNNRGRDEDYWRDTTADTFGIGTTPSSQSYYVGDPGFTISNISATGDPMTFDFQGDTTPHPDGIAPIVGLPAGGQTVTLTGWNFYQVTEVAFGGVPAGSFTVSSLTEMTAVVPAGSVGVVDVSVTNADGTGTLTAAYHYMDAVPQPYTVDFETDPGWVLGPTWSVGPATAYTEPNDRGTEPGDDADGTPGGGILADARGDRYDNDIGRTLWAGTPPIDCTGTTTVVLEFDRWLGVEQARFDHAYVQVTGDYGETWTTVWENPQTVTITDDAWMPQWFDISATAGGQPGVRVRFGIGPTDGGWQYSGFCVDNVHVYELIPPEFQTTPNTWVQAGDTYEYVAQVTGYPAPVVTASGLPGWLSFESGTLTVSGTATAGDAGPNGTLTLTATTPGTPPVEQVWDLAVWTPPVFTSVPPDTLTVGDLYDYTWTTSGYPAPTVTATGLPAWLTASATGLTGTPQTMDAGVTGQIELTATNGADPDGTQTFTITVEGPPFLDGDVPADVAVGQDVAIPLTVAGYPTPTLTADGLPGWLALDGQTLRGQPAAGSVNTDTIFTLTAANGVGKNAERTFTVHVSPNFHGACCGTGPRRENTAALWWGWMLGMLMVTGLGIARRRRAIP